MEVTVRAIRPDDFAEFKAVFTDKTYDDCLYCGEKATKVTECGTISAIRSCDKIECLACAKEHALLPFNP